MGYIDFERQQPLNKLCTFGIGGKAAFYVEVRQLEDLKAVLNSCKKDKLPFFILGKGSNILFSDRDFSGLIIHNKIDFIKQISPGTFHAGAGTSFSLLGVQTARQGWGGLEFASGIPASVGGAVFMNAGANGSDTSQSLHSVEFMDQHGQLHTFARESLEFSYRTSPFQNMCGAIVSATFKLVPSPEAREKQLSIIRYRQSTQPGNQKSAGCVFRNPSCTSAGALIEACGLKGVSFGGAQVSHLHANFIVNPEGKATAEDVLSLMDHIKTQVALKKGILLESEIRQLSDHTWDVE